MKRLVPILLLLATPASAQIYAPPGEPDPRVQTLAYDPGQVVSLRVASRFQLTLLFGADERVENVALGDSDAWQVTLNGRGDALFVKPLRATTSTNMTVITDARVYNFELFPASGPAADTPFTVRFQYPEAPRSSDVEVREPGRYRLSGSRPLRPTEVSDDGERTYIAWRADQMLPAVFALDAQGHETLVDGYVRDGRYVIDAVHPALLFRLDRQTARATRLRPRTRP